MPNELRQIRTEEEIRGDDHYEAEEVMESRRVGKVRERGEDAHFAV